MLNNFEEKTVLGRAKCIASKILNKEVEPVTGCEEIAKLAWTLGLPNDLQNFVYLNEGTASECRRRTWFGLYVFDQTLWLEAVMHESKLLIGRDK